MDTPLLHELTNRVDHGGDYTLVSFIFQTVDHLTQVSGVVNLASPHPLPNREFMKALREAWGTRIGLPAPAWMLEIGTFLLRSESELVLKSRRVVPGRLLAAHFQFLFPEWPIAAQELVGRWKTSTRD